MTSKLKKLLVTGASGGMATGIRPMLSEIAETVVVSGRRPIEGLLPHEECRIATLDDANALGRAMEGCDGVIHLGGYSIEGPFKPILDANITGALNLYEAAQKNGKPRIVFASSNHVVGMYKQSETIDASALPRPDSLYAVSKVFGEALARLYFDKTGQETAIIRLGSCFDTPTDHRMLATWMSHRDFVRFCQAVFTTDTLGCPIVYGVSKNARNFWDNRAADFLGWSPQDTADGYVAEVQETVPNPDPNNPLHIFQGGSFAGLPINPESNDV